MSSLGFLSILIILFILFVIGFPIGFSMAIIGILGIALTTNLQAALCLAAMDFVNVFSSYTFAVIPIFVFMGQLGYNAGIAKSLYKTAYKFVGHVPGGLALATVGGAVMFKAICGSTPATAATFASLAVPEMDNYNYDKKLSCGTVATVGTLGVLMPPSLALVVFGIITEQSIGRLFIAGIVPGLLISFSFFVTIVGWCRIIPKMGPKGETFPWKERLKAIPSIIPIALTFLLVVGGLMRGYFTPVEAGSVGTAAVLILSLVKRDIGLKGLITSLLESLGIACMVLILLAGASICGRFFMLTRIPFLVADLLAGLPFPREVIMIIVMLIYLIGGTFIEDIAFVIIATPIFFPVVMNLGYDPIWFGIMIMVTAMIGMIIPPVAICVFIVSSIAKVRQGVVYAGVYPFLVGLVICTAILLLFPEITLWLPNLVMK